MTNDRPFRCSECPKAYRNRSTLLDHLQKKHGIPRPRLTPEEIRERNARRKEAKKRSTGCYYQAKTKPLNHKRKLYEKYAKDVIFELVKEKMTRELQFFAPVRKTGQSSFSFATAKMVFEGQLNVMIRNAFSFSDEEVLQKMERLHRAANGLRNLSEEDSDDDSDDDYEVTAEDDEQDES